MFVGERIARMLGPAIKELRETLGLTQGELGDLIGRPQKWVSRLENNLKELPEPDVIAALATALKVSESTLLHAAGYLQDSDAPDPLKDPRLTFWAATLEQIPEEDEPFLREVARAYIAQRKREGRGLLD